MADDSSILKVDIFIIILLTLIIIFVAGYYIIKLLDDRLDNLTSSTQIDPSKKSSVSNNKCDIPPIYLNLDKKRIKLNNYIDKDINKNTSTDIIEDYGNLPDHITEVANSNYQQISNNNATLIINKNNDDLVETSTRTDEDILTELSNNYNNMTPLGHPLAWMNNLPYLVDPKNTNEGYLKNKVKLIENPDSLLLKLDNLYKKNIDKHINKCPVKQQFYDGYNQYYDLQKGNYANVTSIGKNLIVPFTSFPVAS
jgi:hypothetical protein